MLTPINDFRFMIKPWRLSRLPTSWSRPQSFSLPPSSTSFSGRTGLPWTAIPSKTRKSASTRCSAAPTCQIDCPERTKFGENLHIHLSENATQIKSKTKNLKFKLWQKHSLKKSQIILFSSIIMMLNVLCKAVPEYLLSKSYDNITVLYHWLKHSSNTT